MHSAKVKIHSSVFTVVLQILLVLAVLAFVYFIDSFIINHSDVADSDFSWFWAGGYAVTHNYDLYNPVDTAQIFSLIGHTRIDSAIAFPYPLWSVIVFVPFGLLPYDVAATLWAVVNQGFLLAAFILFKAALRTGHNFSLTEARNWNKYLLYAGLLPFMLTPHFVHSLLNGQTSFLMTLLLSLFVFFMSKVKSFAAEGSVVSQTNNNPKLRIFKSLTVYELLAGLSLMTWLFKPPLVMVVLPLVLGWLMWQRLWNVILAFAGGSLALLVVSFIIKADWLSGWLHSRTSEGLSALTESSNLWGMFNQLGEGFKIGVGSLLIAVVACSILFAANWQVLRFQTNTTLIFTVFFSLGLATTFYSHNYDELSLLLPGLALLDYAWRLKKLNRILVGLNLAAILIIVPWMLNLEALNSTVAGFYALSLNLFAVVLLGFTGTKLPGRTFAFDGISSTN